MKEDDIGQDYQCPCSQKTCKDCPLGFEKVLDLNNAGLVIYRHSMISEKSKQNTGVGGSDIENDENGFIFHNTKDADIVSKDFLPEMEKRAIKCARCRQIMEHAIKILQKVSAMSKNEIIGICDHCKLKEHPCSECKGALKYFFEKYKERQFIFTKERIRQWVTSVQDEFKGYFVDDKETGRERLKDYKKKYKITGKKLLKAHSEVRLDKICRRSHDKSERKLEIRELCRGSEDQGLANISPIISDKGKKQIIFNFDEQLVEMVDSISTMSLERKTKSAISKTKGLSTLNKDQISSPIPKKEKARNDDKQPGAHQRDSHEDDILPAHHPKQYAHDREKEKLDEEDVFDETRQTDFIFSFPFERKKGEKHEVQKDSSELINDIHDRIREKYEEDLLKKIEEEERKKRDREEKIKLAEEKKRLAEEKKLTENKERERMLLEKSTVSVRDTNWKVASNTTPLTIKQSKSEAAQKEPYSKSKLLGTKSEPKESTTKIKDSKSNKTKLDESSRVPKPDLTDSTTEQKKPKSEPKAESKQKTELKHATPEEEAVLKPPKAESKKPKLESKADSKQPKTETDAKQPKTEKKAESKQPKADIKQPKTDSKQPNADIKQPKTETKADSKQPNADFKQPKTETKADLKQPKPEPKAGSKQPNADFKQPKTETKADLKQPKPEPKAGSKQPKAELDADLKQPKSESKADSKRLRDEPKNDFKQPKADSKEHKVELKQDISEPITNIKQRETELNSDKKLIKSAPQNASEFKKPPITETSSKSKPTKPTDQSKESRDLRLTGDLKETKSESKKSKVVSKESKDSKAESKRTKTEPVDLKGTKDFSLTEIVTGKPNKEKDKKEKDGFPNVEKDTEKTKKGKDTTTKVEEERRVPRRQLEAQLAAQEDKTKPNKEQKNELKADHIEMLKQSQNLLALNLVKVKDAKRTLSQIMTPSQIVMHEMEHKNLKGKGCPMCINSNLELEYESRKKRTIEQKEMIKGRKIKCVPAYTEETDDHGVKPILFQIKYDDKFNAEIVEPPKHIPIITETSKESKTPKPLVSCLYAEEIFG